MSRGSNNSGAQSTARRRRMLHFIAKGEPNSVAAQANLATILDGHSHLECDVRTIDVFEDHETALEYGVLVTPCLVLVEPEPRVMVVGTLVDTDRVRTALRLSPAERMTDA